MSASGNPKKNKTKKTSQQKETVQSLSGGHGGADSPGDTAGAHSLSAASAGFSLLEYNAEGRFFDALSWSTDTSPAALPTGEVYENRIGWPHSTILFDQTPPEGQIIINENQASGGIAVRQFAVYGEEQTGGGSGTASNEALDNKFEGWQIQSLGKKILTHVTVRLKVSAGLTNGAERVYVNLYDHDPASGQPGNRVARSTETVLFSALTTSYQDLKLACAATLEQDEYYWIVVERTAAPAGGTIYLEVIADDDALYASLETGTAWATASGKRGAYTLTGRSEGGAGLAGRTLAHDMLDMPLREASDFGGTDNPESYETIGASDAYALVRYLDKSGPTYPKVLMIEIGAQSSKAKAYTVDVKLTPDDSWRTIYKTITSSTEEEYIRYTFKSAVPLYAVRMRYRGDFYALGNEATLTVAGYDPLTDVESIQVSHYSDFRDATDFSLADEDGWVSFGEGVSLYDWTIRNTDRLWTARDGTANLALRRGARLGTTLILADKNNLYTLPLSGSLTLQQSLGATVTIADLHVFRNRIYAGASNGYLYASSSGSTYTILNPPASNLDPTPVPLAPIGAVSSFGGKVIVATNATSTEFAALWLWDGTGFTLIRRFAQPRIHALQVSNSFLFVATGGLDGFKQGAIYYYDGAEWSLTLQTESDAVQALATSTATSRLYAGLKGGSVWQLDFDSAGKPQTWSRAHSFDSRDVLGLSDDPSGDFFWAHGSGGLEAYIKALDGFYSVDPPVYTRTGLRTTWTNSDSDNVKQLGIGASQVETISSQVNFTNLSTTRPTGVNATYVNAVWEGFVVPTTTETYTFYVNAKEGYRLYVAGALIIDAWEDHASATETNGTLVVYADQKTPIRLEFYYKTGVPSVILSWQAPSFAKQVIPSGRFYTPNIIGKTIYQGTSAYGLSLDGNVYLMDTSDLGQSKRRAYLLLRDAAGNVTALPGFDDEVVEGFDNSGGDSGGGSGGDSGDGSVAASSGRILHIRPRDKSLQATFTSPVEGALFSPDRALRASGVYVAEPFYAATLTQWTSLSMLAVLSAGAEQGNGLERGMAVELYVRTGDTRDQVLAADWGTPFASSTINAPGNTNAGVTPIAFNISTLSGKWLQYKAVLVSASRNLSPTLRSVVLSYAAANASYFFTKVFDTSEESALVPAPEFRRGLLTANTMENGGRIVFAYTTNTEEGSTFDFTRYTEIEPNTVFELTAPSSTIRFGILLVSVDAMNLAVVDDFAVQLDPGPVDMKFMD